LAVALLLALIGVLHFWGLGAQPLYSVGEPREATEVVEEIDRHYAWLQSSGELEKRRTRRARDEIEAIAVTALRERWGDVHGRSELDDLASAVAAGKSDPYAAADELLDAFTEA